MTLDEWFASRGWTPFQFQRDVWSAYLAGESGLIHAATGTGKTLAAWGGALKEWECESAGVRERVRVRRDSAPPLRVLWITPLRALAADTEEALRQPLDEIGIPWTLESRTGDTSAAVRARQSKRLPTALNGRYISRSSRPAEQASSDGADHDAGVTIAAAHACRCPRDLQRSSRRDS
jgi:ATP-dependent helicase Lhr and Lhr-like helicase